MKVVDFPRLALKLTKPRFWRVCFARVVDCLARLVMVSNSLLNVPAIAGAVVQVQQVQIN